MIKAPLIPPAGGGLEEDLNRIRELLLQDWPPDTFILHYRDKPSFAKAMVGKQFIKKAQGLQ